MAGLGLGIAIPFARRGAATAPSCSITLDTDSAAGLGLQPAEIDGQSFGVTSSSAGTGYLASTDADAPTALWGSGRRWIEIHTYSLSGTDTSASIRAGFARLDTFVTFVMRARSNSGDPLRDILLLDNTGTPIATVSVAAGTGAVALGIDSSGNCFYDIGNGPVRPGGAFDAAFAGANIALLGIASFTNAAESASMGIRTNGADYTYPKFSGDGDWCANALALWTPDAVLAGVTDSFWRTVSAGTLFEDAGLTTPADTTADPIGGVVNESSIGTSTLSQATTADKFKVASDLRMERDGTVSTQHLLFGMTIALANGFCIAIDVDAGVLGTAPIFIGGENSHLSVTKTALDHLALKVGGTTSRAVLDAFDTPRKRVIVTGDNVDYEVFVDGVSAGTFASQATTSTFSQIVLGIARVGLTNAVAWKCGNVLIAEKDMRSEFANLDAWLGG